MIRGELSRGIRAAVVQVCYGEREPGGIRNNRTVTTPGPHSGPDSRQEYYVCHRGFEVERAMYPHPKNLPRVSSTQMQLFMTQLVQTSNTK